MSAEFLKPVIDAIAAGGPVKKVVGKQLEKIDRARIGLQAQISDLTEQRRLILTLAQRFAADEDGVDEAESDAVETLANAAIAVTSSNGAGGGASPIPPESEKPGLTEREKLAAREIIDKGLAVAGGKLSIEQVVAEMQAQGFEMNVASPATALGSILYHRRKAYEAAQAAGRLPLESNGVQEVSP